jgi:DNA-binding GntR family transcriptional regulator
MADGQVEVVRTALETLEAVAQDHGSPQFWELHRDFHWALLEPGANSWIRRVLEQVWLASQRYVRLFVSETVDDAMADHRELLVCCEERAGVRAAEVLRRHLDLTELAVRQAFLPVDGAEAG